MKRLKQVMNKKQNSWFVLYPCCGKAVGYIHLNEHGQYVGVYTEKRKYKTFKDYYGAVDWLNKVVAACSDCQGFKQLKFKISRTTGRKRKMVTVSGEAMGNLGIHKENDFIWPNGKYNVTHIKNGFKIRSFVYRYRARKFIEMLHETGLAKALDEWVAGDCKGSFGIENSAKLTKLGKACTYRTKEMVEKLNGADVLAEG